MNATNHETHELTLQELEIVAGGGLATPKGSINTRKYHNKCSGK